MSTASFRTPCARLSSLLYLALSTILVTPTLTSAHELPVGDGRVSQAPKAGYVFACQTAFRGGGARHVGEWFHGETWDPAAKPHVAGKVAWPQAAFSLNAVGEQLTAAGNGLPVGQLTGVFPIAADDPVYKYDTNPNPVRALPMSFGVPLRPVKAAQPACLPMGMIGVTTTGVALYNALDDAGRDAAAHEVQDLCDGHPQGKGQYHYHSGSPCMSGGGERNEVVGWALDGYPILGMRDAAGRLLGNSDLDACHGRNEEFTVDGRAYQYAYRLTREYPYVMGCFSGTVIDATRQAIRTAVGPPKQRSRRPEPQRQPAGAPGI